MAENEQRLHSGPWFTSNDSCKKSSIISFKWHNSCEFILLWFFFFWTWWIHVIYIYILFYLAKKNILSFNLFPLLLRNQSQWLLIYFPFLVGLFTCRCSYITSLNGEVNNVKLEAGCLTFFLSHHKQTFLFCHGGEDFEQKVVCLKLA